MTALLTLVGLALASGWPESTRFPDDCKVRVYKDPAGAVHTSASGCPEDAELIQAWGEKQTADVPTATRNYLLGPGQIGKHMAVREPGDPDVDWSRLKIKRTRPASRPEGADDLWGFCETRLYITEKGKVADVEFEHCPDVFKDSAQEAGLGMKFYGTGEQTTFVISLHYRPR